MKNVNVLGNFKNYRFRAQRFLKTLKVNELTSYPYLPITADVLRLTCWTLTTDAREPDLALYPANLRAAGWYRISGSSSEIPITVLPVPGKKYKQLKNGNLCCYDMINT
jgi:hypothetical protein